MNVKEIVRLLATCTANRFDLWFIAGDGGAKWRVEIMSAVVGKRVPQSKAGFNALRDALYAVPELNPGDGCRATQDSEFQAKCRKIMAAV